MVLAAVAAGLVGGFAMPSVAAADCTMLANRVVAENCKPGSPASEWDVAGAGSPDIQGFATDISANAGSTIHFKIKTPATAYRLDIYRMGYYGGDGARRVTSVSPSASLPPSQPPCAGHAQNRRGGCGHRGGSAARAGPAGAPP